MKTKTTQKTKTSRRAKTKNSNREKSVTAANAQTGMEQMFSSFGAMLKQQTEVLNSIAQSIGNGIRGRKSTVKGVEKESQNGLERLQHTPINADSVFMETLRQIGSNATTKEVAARLVRTNPEWKKMARKNHEQFMQYLYTSASNLSKNGDLLRVPAGKRRYAYGLKVWNKSPKKTANKK